MPRARKSDMLNVVKEKFDIPPGHEEWIMKSLGHKWKNWKANLKSKFYGPNLSVDEQLHKKPDRVHEDQWKELLMYWDSEEGKRTSKRNQRSRDKLLMTHTLGKRSYARINEEKKKSLGHSPTRVDMFFTCYTRKNGQPSTKQAKNVMEKMNELASTAEKDTQDKSDANDIFSQAMGKERHGRVRMYGLGVAPSDIWGETSSRSTSYRKAMQWKTACEQMEEKFQNLNDQFMELRSLVSQGKAHGEIPYDGSNSQSQHHTLHSSTFNQKPKSLQVGDRVLLKSIANSTKSVANGVIHSIDSSTTVGGEELGPDWCEVNIQVPIMWEERLIRSYGIFRTIGDAIGATIAWPLSLVVRANDF